MNAFTTKLPRIRAACFHWVSEFLGCAGRRVMLPFAAAIMEKMLPYHGLRAEEDEIGLTRDQMLNMSREDYRGKKETYVASFHLCI